MSTPRHELMLTVLQEFAETNHGYKTIIARYKMWDVPMRDWWIEQTIDQAKSEFEPAQKLIQALTVKVLRNE